jgi:serine/threonine protein phosphatase PrpC
MSEQPQRDSSPSLVDGADGLNGADQPDDPTTASDNIARGQLTVRYAGRTAVGQVREHNEDNFVIANLSSGQIRPRDQSLEDEIGERGMLFSVCDGMGGAAAGEVASQMAVDILVEAMRRGASPKNRDALARRLVQAVEEAGRRIFQSAQKERSRRGMGTTTTAAVLIDKVLFLGEVGDSRGYLLRDGQLKQITKDQSLVNQLIEAGHLTEDEAEAFEHSNIILQALGTAESVNVDLTFVELRKGDRLLLCSDGLSGLVHTDTLRTALAEVKDPSDCCLKLIELAEAGGGHDNITCIVADFDGDQLTSPAEGDGFGYMQYPLPLSDDDSSAFVEDETAGGPRRESTEDPSSAPTQRPMAVASDHDDDLDGDDSRANALWILAGAVALIGALGVWWTLDPKAQGSTERPPAVQPPPAPAAPAEPVVEEVQVNVYTDVASATLLVNGDSQGALSAEQSKSLKLKPGAYRFEAQADGQPKAVTVVTVRGDMPMDVFLKTPAAAAEEPKPEGKAAEPKAGEPKAAEPKEPKPAEDKPQTAAPEEPAAPVAAEGEEPAPRKPRKRPAAAEPPVSAEPAAPPATPELPSNPF